MKTMWPNLAPVINESLAKLTEFVLRDYVASWYAKMDENVVYEDPTMTTVATTTTTGTNMTGAVSSSNLSQSSTASAVAIHATTPSNSASSARPPSQFSKSMPAASTPSMNSSQHSNLSSSVSSVPTPMQQQQKQPQHTSQNQQQQRTMVLTTTGTLPSPFIDSLYTSFAYLLGMLATRASENVNVLELLLLHLPHVLAQNLRVYRELRGVALEKKKRREMGDINGDRWRKQQMRSVHERGDVSGSRRQFTTALRGSMSGESVSGEAAAGAVASPTQHTSHSDEEISEVAIIREYLLAGRLHRALTFGLDVPSLLFADPLAKDCPPSSSFGEISERNRMHGYPDEDSVLEDRLLSPESSLVTECELDYNRVLSSKMAKLVVPKNEVESSIVRTILVEMLASCVLGPVMGCFTPDYVNSWIITGLGLLEDDGTDETAGSTVSMTRADSAASFGERNQSLTSFSRDEHHDGAGHSPGIESDVDELLDTVFDGAAADLGEGEGSVTSEMEEPFFDMDDASKGPLGLTTCNKAEQIITLLSMSIIELRSFIDFEDCRHAKEHDQDVNVNWDAPSCREAVRHLVLVIEAALLLGVRPERRRHTKEVDATNTDLDMVEATLDQDDSSHATYEFESDMSVAKERKNRTAVMHQHSSLSAALMELTGDIDGFEKLVLESDQQLHEADDDSVVDMGDFTPRQNEMSTLRTLIAAWLHTGQAFRVLSIIAKAKETILRPFYYRDAFLRRDNYSRDFTRLLRQLEGVEILVDTMAVLASQCLLSDGGFNNLIESFEKEVARVSLLKKDNSNQTANSMLLTSGMFGQQGTTNQTVVRSVRANFAQNRDRLARFAQSATESFHFGAKGEQFDDQQSMSTKSSAQVAYYHHQSSHAIPAYIDYSKNSVFASSLRSERDRRNDSWHKEVDGVDKVEFVCRTKGANEKDTLMHRELHHLSRFFYSNTNEIHIEPCSFGDIAIPSSESAGNVTVKAIASRRKIEVPDEDSSFLLRAQPRPLKPAAIHRDQRSPNMACKIYVAMYEEPVIHPKTKRYYGGRYLRQCLMRYYPSDKTASVTVAKDLTVMDRRQKGQLDDKYILTDEFQKLRHSCLKVATSGMLLSSPLMEPNDFSATPRSGKALDFIHRISLFERPMIELGGKKFVVHDASSLTTHRADASCLELSDASMSAAIILRGSCGLNVCDNVDTSPRTFSIKVSSDGTPLVLLRAQGNEQRKDEARPYRPSFIRAALLVKSARQEAQAQCLAYCIKAGSARSSSKIKSDEWLQPTLRLLQYANSRRQEEQSILLRDLQLGINHIDRGQLCRNGLLNPRYPTVLRGLTISVIGSVEVKTSTNVDLLGTPSLILFKIRCTAITEFIGEEGDDDFVTCNDDNKHKTKKSRYFREEWTVLRSLREFSVFHKHIKSQVSPTEHSAGTGARLVGAATAITSSIVGGGQASKKERGPLVPSLSKATQVGTLGLSSKKVIEKRKKLLDEYLKYLVAPNNLLSRCPELLKFLGAYTSIFPVESSDSLDDEFGREDVTRVELDTDKLKSGIVQVKKGSTEQVRMKDVAPKEAVTSPKADTPVQKKTAAATSAEESATPADKKRNNATKRIAMIRSGEIRLKDVRRSLFRLLRDLFDLDNASFFRSRVISVIKTMSVAVTNAQDFHVMLFKSHLKYMNGDWVSGWIFYLVDMFWPNGVFYTKGPDLTESEQLDLKRNSKYMLEKVFPDQLKTVLGKHMDEGLDLLHEMLQNKLVLKSIGYMLMDLVWAEVFPELSDFTTGAECLIREG
eukprot:scaffold13812_cov262-Alexandrium_tamarense.AAC.3